MPIIKSFTDLSQSKKLAEILPLNSADNAIVSIGDREGIKTITMPKETFNVLRTPFSDIRNTTPCWSLASLINIIPQELFDGEYIINITEGVNHKWIISYEPPYEVSSYVNTSSDSLIDCCVEMIIKLKKRNLL